MKTKSRLNRKVQIAFGSALLTLLIVGVLSYRSMIASSESVRWVRHTHEVMESLQDLLLSMETVESSSRGFALTGNDSYLLTYHAGTLKATSAKESVAHLTIDNLGQQRRLSDLERLMNE